MADTPLEVVVTTGLWTVAGAAGEDAELGTREPASLSGWVTAVEALSLLLVEDTWPKQQEEGFTATQYTFTACVIRICSYTYLQVLFLQIQSWLSLVDHLMLLQHQMVNLASAH